MTKEIMKQASALGKLIAESEEVKAAREAREAYEKDPAVQDAIFEYNTQNKVLAEEYKKEKRDEAFMETVKKRIGELYNTIVNNSTYVAYLAAEEKVNGLMKLVNDVINFQVTGERPSESACTGNCSSCGGCH